MISGMSALAAHRGAVPASRRLPVVLAGVAGCLFLAAASSSIDADGLSAVLDTPDYGYRSGSPSNLAGWLFLAAPAIATAVGLCLLRWWPYLLAVAGLMAVPGVVVEWNPDVGYPWVFVLLPPAVYVLALVALLACAQGLAGGMGRWAGGWGAAIAALTLGSRLVGAALPKQYPQDGWISLHTAASWQTALLGAGLAGLAPAVWLYRRGDPAATGPIGSRQRVRLITAGTLAAAVSIPLAFLTTGRLADLLGVTWSALERHGLAQTAAIGAITVVTVTLLAAS